jgi:hypothetical protein
MLLKWIRYLSLTLLGLAVLLSLTVILIGRWIDTSMRPKSHFDNYTEAQASGIMDRGWIPHYIPKSATDINEQHDLDTNWVKMTFNYALDDLADLRSACQSEVAIANGTEFLCERHIMVRLFNDGTAQLEKPVK